MLQEIEDLKLSNKKQAQVLQEVAGKFDKYDSARRNGAATDDLSEENADRTGQHTKERHELGSAKPTKSTVGADVLLKLIQICCNDPIATPWGSEARSPGFKVPHQGVVVPDCDTTKIIIVWKDQ